MRRGAACGSRRDPRACHRNSVADSAYEGADDAFDEGNAAGPFQESHRCSNPPERLTVDLRLRTACQRPRPLATTAILLGMWHTRQRHRPTWSADRTARRGRAQRCTQQRSGWQETASSPCGTGCDHGVIDHEDRLLLQHNSAWARRASPFPRIVRPARIWSTPAVARPGGGRHQSGSCDTSAQPWPFPASLMMAFKGLTTTDDSIQWT